MSQSADTLVHATAAGNQVRCLAAVTTGLVGEACRRHRTFPTASVALGRSLTGSLLLGSGLKDLERITIHFDCDGPIGNIVTQADAHGNVRGYVSNPEADATAANPSGKFDVRAVVGGGTLFVTRDAGFEIGLLKKPYSGSVPIVSGEIGHDLAYYLTMSEQLNSALSLGVHMRVEGNSGEAPATAGNPEFAVDRLRVAAAGGFVVQMLPGAAEEVIARIEQTVSSAPSSTEMVRAGMSAREMLEQALGGIEFTILEEKKPRFHCPCSRERARYIISALGRDEIKDMLASDGGAELICHFCSEAYQFNAAELEQIIEAEPAEEPLQ
jgi:molecular chaperone Hsp33